MERVTRDCRRYDLNDGRTLTIWDAPEDLGRDLLKADAQRIFNEVMLEDLQNTVLDLDY